MSKRKSSDTPIGRSVTFSSVELVSQAWEREWLPSSLHWAHRALLRFFFLSAFCVGAGQHPSASPWSMDPSLFSKVTQCIGISLKAACRAFKKYTCKYDVKYKLTMRNFSVPRRMNVYIKDLSVHMLHLVFIASQSDIHSAREVRICICDFRGFASFLVHSN